MSRLSVTVPAKLNLHLQVLGFRSDGYHQLGTLFQSVDLVDEVWAEPAPEGVLELQTEPEDVLSAADDNLVLRAASALRDRSNVKSGARLGLAKKIPVGAGLGGGSADAAATLVLLDTLWELDLGLTGLTEIATQLGSDVPFFLHGGLALGVGRGEEIHPLPDLNTHGILIAKPSIQLATVKVFESFPGRLTWERLEATVEAFVEGASEELPWRDLRNDLEPVVFDRWPEVGRLVETFRGLQPLHAAMSGSGAAAFAVFSNVEMARKAAQELEDKWWFHVGETLDRARSRLVVHEEGTREESRS
jgi:4-diphosphocytidyl-2-C-methyl-D-erythritol kinase